MAILTPDQRLRVFVSSTLGELAADRAAVRAAIERLRLRPVMFELGARPYPPRALYRAYLEQSHIFIGMYFERYGWVADDMTISGLEDEYRLSDGLPRLLYIKEPAPGREPRLAHLLGDMALLPDVQPRVFSSAEELTDLVADDLAVLLSGHFEGRTPGADTAAPITESKPRTEPLPTAITSFIGRSREVEELAVLLLRDDVRLVTLAGMGGIGKTRLALEAARVVEGAFPDGVHLVKLATVTQADLVIPTVASALGIRVEEKRAPDAGLIEALAGRRMLLILDNFEQVMDAAGVVGRLLESAPELHILVTSRRRLRLRAEHEYQVPTLTLPEQDGTVRPEEIAETEAVQLFVERASAVRPGFRLTEADAAAVAEIVRRLEGVPLAIELAAARVRLLPPAALLKRLDHAVDLLSGGLMDLPDRQRSLRATLDWSYSLLDPDEQQLVARLAAFRGGWTLEAAEAVCAADDAERDHVLDRLAGLVDNSLVMVELSERTSEARFRMLEPVREYAREKLIASGEDEAVVRRHLHYFESLTHEAGRALAGRDQARWLDVLEQEAGNLGAAAARAMEWGEPAMLVDVAWHIWIWLWLNDHVTEARHWLEPVYENRESLAPLQHARLHWVLGCLLFEHGHFDRAAPLLHTAVAEFTALGDEEGRGLALMNAGGVLPYEGDDEKCQAYLAEAVAVLRGRGDRFSASIAAGALGMHWLRRGDVDTAERLINDAMDDARAIDNAPMQALIQLYLSFVFVTRGNLAGARELLEQVVARAGDRRSDEVFAYSFEGMAGIALLEGDAARCATLLGIAHGLRQRAALTIWPDMQPLVDGLISGAKAALGDERYDIAWTAGHNLNREAAKAFALERAPAPAPAPLE